MESRGLVTARLPPAAALLRRIVWTLAPGTGFGSRPPRHGAQVSATPAGMWKSQHAMGGGGSGAPIDPQVEASVGGSPWQHPSPLHPRAPRSGVYGASPPVRLHVVWGRKDEATGGTDAKDNRPQGHTARGHQPGGARGRWALGSQLLPGRDL